NNLARLTHNFNAIPIDNNAKTIGILCLPGFGWDPTTDNKLSGGSEEAVLNVADDLSKRNYLVTVFNGNKSCWSLPHMNPRYCSEEYLKTTFDVIIVWRNANVKLARKFGKKVYLWSHDIYYFYIPINLLDGCLWLTYFQKKNHENNQP